jgi:ectoine hydroxylase-related dioxygenase (phytanoyl-CoA dioxygenase family)
MKLSSIASGTWSKSAMEGIEAMIDLADMAKSRMRPCGQEKGRAGRSPSSPRSLRLGCDVSWTTIRVPAPRMQEAEIEAELSDSSDAADDADELRSRLAREGYLLLRGLLDDDRVRTCRRDVLARLEAIGWVEQELDGSYRPGRPRVDRTDEFDIGRAAVQSSEPFHRVPHDPALARVIRGVLETEDVLLHPLKVSRIVWPARQAPQTQFEAYTGPHQDYPYLRGVVDTLTTWIPLDNVKRTDGGLQIAPRSQHRGVVRDPQELSRGLSWSTADYGVGDVLIFHGLTLHRASPNQGDMLRLSMDCRWQEASEPVNDECLQPQGYPRIPGWDVLTENWHSLAWIQAPGARPVSYDMSAPVDTEMTSRFVSMGAADLPKTST